MAAPAAEGRGRDAGGSSRGLVAQLRHQEALVAREPGDVDARRLLRLRHAERRLRQEPRVTRVPLRELPS